MSPAVVLFLSSLSLVLFLAIILALAGVGAYSLIRSVAESVVRDRGEQAEQADLCPSCGRPLAGAPDPCLPTDVLVEEQHHDTQNDDS